MTDSKTPETAPSGAKTPDVEASEVEVSDVETSESEEGFTVDDLRKALEGLPGDMPIVVEVDLRGGMAQAEITGCAKGDNALLLFSNDGD